MRNKYARVKDNKVLIQNLLKKKNLIQKKFIPDRNKILQILCTTL